MNDGARVLVVYESMFGCTESVARAVAEGLAEGGFTVDLENVRDAEGPSGRSFDLLVLGAPTHAFSLSRPSTRLDAVRQGAPAEVATTGVREWLAGIKGRDGRPAAAFDTRVTKTRRLPKAASTRAARLLRRRGFRIVERPTAFLVADVQGPLVDGELERARGWGIRLAHDHAPGLPGAAAG
jgi:hypothetical protein